MLALLRFLCCPIVGRLALSIVRSLVANKTPRLSLTDRITHAKGVPWGKQRCRSRDDHSPTGSRTHGGLTVGAPVVRAVIAEQCPVVSGTTVG
jgi:hypothetical protein